MIFNLLSMKLKAHSFIAYCTLNFMISVFILGAFLGGVQGFYSGWKHMGAIDQKASIKRTQYENPCFIFNFIFYTIGIYCIVSHVIPIQTSNLLNVDEFQNTFFSSMGKYSAIL